MSRPAPQHPVRFAFTAAFVVAAALGACRTPVVAPALVPRPEPKPQLITMDPVTLRATPSGKVVAEFSDPASIFDEADKLFREKKHAEALRQYDRLLELAPQSKYRMVSLYNGGLALERLKRFDEAAERYKKVMDEQPRTRDAVDAGFRLGECLMKAKKFKDAADLFTRLLLRDDLKPADAFEARVRKGTAHSELAEDDDAERTLLRAVRYHAEASRTDSVYDPGLLAQAYYHLGEVAHRRMHAAPLRLPQAQIEQDLNRKGHLLLAAQARFLRAIRTADAEWSPAAGHQLGAVYEQFHSDIIAAPLPPELNAQEKEVYLEELHKKIRTLIKKAVGIYQRTLALSERLGGQSPWVAKTKERMEKLQRYLDEGERKAQTPAKDTAAPNAKSDTTTPKTGDATKPRT